MAARCPTWRAKLTESAREHEAATQTAGSQGDCRARNPVLTTRHGCRHKAVLLTMQLGCRVSNLEAKLMESAREHEAKDHRVASLETRLLGAIQNQHLRVRFPGS